MMIIVPMTLEQIVEETRHWPPEKVGELVGRLTKDLHASDPETETSWKTEIARRIEEIQTGKVQGIPVEEVFEKARRIVAPTDTIPTSPQETRVWGFSTSGSGQHPVAALRNFGIATSDLL